ncbi:MAG: poly-beta-hydroxybutyrate polymerase N-terminal domain-containing protein [Oricola sp.]
MSKRLPLLTKAVAFPEARGGFSFDLPLHAAMARLAAGISLTALAQAYDDWARPFPEGLRAPRACAGSLRPGAMRQT